MFNEDDAEVGPRGTFETYRAEGDGLFQNGAYKKAIDSYTTALELQHGDKECLVARSRCHLQLGKTQEALADAESSLKEEPNYHKGLYQKAEALYCKGEFELALMFYHRGHKMRPELHEFRLGIQKAQEAIDNSVGSPEKVKLTREGDLSFFKLLIEPLKPGKGKAKQRNPSRSIASLAAKQTPKSAGNDKTVKQLLGEMYGDRIYLEKLLKETDKLTDTGRSIHDSVSDGIKYLNSRTDFWRQQKPMYARRREQQMRITGTKHDNKTAPSQHVIQQLEKIDNDLNRGHNKDCLRRARRLLAAVEGYPEGALQNKEEVVAQLHSSLGTAHLEMNDYDKALKHYQFEMALAEKYDIEDAKSRSLDNLGRVYARLGEYTKAVAAWSIKLTMSKSSLEKTWLYHEIGRCHLEMNEYAEAHSFGEKSVEAAVIADDQLWHLNATVLVAQAEVQLGELRAALESFEKAHDLSLLQDDGIAKSAIKKAIEDVNMRIVQQIKDNKAENSSEDSELLALAQCPSPPPTDSSDTPLDMVDGEVDSASATENIEHTQSSNS